MTIKDCGKGAGAAGSPVFSFTYDTIVFMGSPALRAYLSALSRISIPTISQRIRW